MYSIDEDECLAIQINILKFAEISFGICTIFYLTKLFFMVSIIFMVFIK